MKVRQIVIILLSSLFLFGCTGTKSPQISQEKNNVVQTKTGQDDLPLQPAANDAKKRAKKMKRVKAVRAVELNRNLYVVVEPKHQYTFQAEKITKDLKTELEKEWPDKEIRVTTDHKFFIELDRLEKRIQENTITKNNLNKELGKLKKLLDEQI